MKIKIIIEKTKTGFSAYAEKYSVYTTGKDIAELKFNILEATNLFFYDKEKKISEMNLELSDINFL